MGILTVGVVTKPFQFEGVRRMRVADAGIDELQQSVDTLIVIPNQNLFRVANEKTTFADAFAMADQVLYSGVACITDLMVKEGLINLDFADVRAVMRGMGKAMMGTGEASGEKRANRAAEAAIANPLLDDVSMKGARGLLISITGGRDLTLYEVDEAATRIREEVDSEANIILGATFDESLEGIIRVSVVATGIDQALITDGADVMSAEQRISQVAERLRAEARARAPQVAPAIRAPTPEPVALRQVEALAFDAPAEVAHPEAAQPVLRDEVVLTPMQSKQAVAYDPPPPPAAPVEDEAAGARAPYIPPQAERAIRPARMPRVDELPVPAQNQIRASRGEVDPAQDKRRSLLQRLATVGFGRKDELPSRSRSRSSSRSKRRTAPRCRRSMPSTRSVRPRRAIAPRKAISTTRAGRPRRSGTSRTISSRFPPSSAARRTSAVERFGEGPRTHSVRGPSCCENHSGPTT
jgi:cell division protein FtsZ